MQDGLKEIKKKGDIKDVFSFEYIDQKEEIHFPTVDLKISKIQPDQTRQENRDALKSQD